MLDNKNTIETIIINAVNEVLNDHEVIPTTEINRESKLIDDLKFTSLMFAQLIMLIQEEIEREPFTDEDGYSISDMVSIKDLINAYTME